MITKELLFRQAWFFVGVLIGTWYLIYWLWGRSYDKKNQ